jgi:hypothetical protein
VGKRAIDHESAVVKQTNGTFDFDITKADKLFDLLVKEG